LAQLVHSYLKKLDELDNVVIGNAENILAAIDLDELLKDPEGYLMALGTAFLDEHMDEVETAHKEGVKFADKILKKI
jgi:hypothetical protein